MQFTLSHQYGIPAERFWDDVFFDDGYNEQLYGEGLRFEAFDIQQFERREDGTAYRRVRVTPRLVMPKPVKKIFGDSVSYVEEGRLDTRGHFVTTIIPNRMADKIHIGTDMWLEPRGAERCERFARFEVKVRAFGLGKILERFFEKTMRDSYEAAASFTNDWIARR